MANEQDYAKKMIALARTQVGYKEGVRNKQKYSDEVPTLEWSQNQPWCATFVSWLAMKTGASKLYPRTASCDAGGNWFKQQGRWSEYPAVGAQVFYGYPYDLNHTGIVYKYDNDYIYTIEGNTNDSGSREGDGVYYKKRLRRGTNVIGYGYPKFPLGIESADPAYAHESPAKKLELLKPKRLKLNSSLTAHRTLRVTKNNAWANTSDQRTDTLTHLELSSILKAEGVDPVLLTKMIQKLKLDPNRPKILELLIPDTEGAYEQRGVENFTKLKKKLDAELPKMRVIVKVQARTPRQSLAAKRLAAAKAAGFETLVVAKGGNRTLKKMLWYGVADHSRGWINWN